MGTTGSVLKQDPITLNISPQLLSPQNHVYVQLIKGALLPAGQKADSERMFSDNVFHLFLLHCLAALCAALFSLLCFCSCSRWFTSENDGGLF